MRIWKIPIRSRTARIGIVMALTATAVVSTANPAFAAAGVLTVSPSTGPAGGGNVITATTTVGTNAVTTFVTGAVAVEFSYTACTTNYAAPVTTPTTTAGGVQNAGVFAATSVTVKSTTSLAITVPAIPLATSVAAQTSASYYVCVYNSTSTSTSVLISGTSSAAYTIVGGLLTLSSYRGPSGGGNVITATTDSGTFGTAPATAVVEFQYVGTGAAGGCSATYATPVAPTDSSATVQNAGVVAVPPANEAVNSTTSLTFIVPSTLTLATTVAQQISADYNVCVYSGSLNSSALISGTNSPYTVNGGLLTVNPTRGPSGGGNTITLTTASGSFGTSAATAVVEFQYVGTGTGASCSATYATPAAPAASAPGTQTAGVVAVPSANETVNSTTSLTVVVPPALALVSTSTVQQPSANYNVCVYNGSTSTSTLVAGTINPYSIGNIITLGTPKGPSGGGNTIVVSLPSGMNFVDGAVAVEFQYAGSGAAAACTPTYASASNITPAAAATTPIVQTAGTINVPSNAANILAPGNRLSVTVPAALALTTGTGINQTTADYNVCVYNGSTVGTSTLIGATANPYSIGEKPTVTGVSPIGGPTSGKTTITVSGTKFPTTGGITASLGGTPLTNITVINPTTFTAITSPHTAGGPYAISVATPGGTATMNNAFTYSNGIIVGPPSGPNTKLAGTVVDLVGTGFSGLAFTFGPGDKTTGATPDDPDAHVYLVKGVYDPTGTTSKANSETQECTNVLVVSDTELLCTLRLTTSLNAVDLPNIAGRTFSDATGSTSSTTITSPTANFSDSDVGMQISTPDPTTDIPLNTTITSVTNKTTAVLSAMPLSNLSGVAVTIGPRTLAITSASTGTSLTAGAAANVAGSDVGRSISGAGIPYGTTITAVSGTTITISQAVTVGGATTVTLGSRMVGAVTPSTSAASMTTTGVFTSQDLGRTITAGGGIPVGTFITGLSSDLKTAYLSQQPTASASTTVTLENSVAVKNGTYTLTVVSTGVIGANTTLPDYYQSIISSGSTFTVSDY
jgi:IPT/TIG domain